MKKIICMLLMFLLIFTGTNVVMASDFSNDDALMTDKTIYAAADLVSVSNVVLDDEYSLEICDYEYTQIAVYATNSQKQYSRSYRIYRTSDNETMVQWRLTGIFTFNGTTSTCEQATMTCNNYQTSVYTVTAKNSYTSGCYAVGNCGAKNVETGTVYSHTIRFGVNPDGNII